MSYPSATGARVDWGVGSLDLGLDDGDPFAGVVAPEQTGLPIDLSTDEPALNEKLVELVNSENALASKGVRCALKDHADSTCSACPVSHHEESGDMATLCRIGRKQEEVVMELHVLRDGHAG